MLETKAALESIKRVDDAVGALAKVVSKLKAQPDLAAAKLAEALDEVAKTWQAMDGALTAYLRLGIDDDGLEKGSETLLEIQGGGLLVKVKQGRGHCHVIGNIFRKYLDRWFERVLKGDELDSIRGVFRMLGEADDDTFYLMERTAEDLQVEADRVLGMVIAGKKAAARDAVLDARQALVPIRLSLSRTMARLYDLKSAFIQIAGTV